MSRFMSAVIAHQDVKIEGGAEFDIPQKIDAQAKRVDTMNVTVTHVIPNFSPV